MWEENSQWLTLLVHFLIALSTTGLYWFMRYRAKAKRINLEERKNCALKSNQLKINTDNKMNKNL